jgi:hypothetical protein
MKPEDFKKAVEKVNELLVKGEPSNIESYSFGEGSDKVEGTGYRIQHVIDAVNEAFGNGWKYAVPLMSEAQGKEFWVGVELSFRVGGEWQSRGIQYGSGSAKMSIGDARKTAISDGIKKSFALWSIGNKSFRGELTLDGDETARREILRFIDFLHPLYPDLTPNGVTPVVKKTMEDNYMMSVDELDTVPAGDRERILLGLKRNIIKFVGEVKE